MDKSEEFINTKKFAEQGNVKAQYDLGIFYLKGHGVKKNMEEGVKWFRQSAELDALTPNII